MTDISNLSSLEKLLLGIDQLEMQTIIVPLRKDSICPQCNSGKLDYNGLLQLECSACGFVNAEGGGGHLIISCLPRAGKFIGCK